MAEKELRTRMVQKHDTEENWKKATNFTPKQGEIIIYDVDAEHNYQRLKIGDGKTNVSNLSFITQELTWKGEWNSTISYDAGDLVSYQGSTYICLSDNSPEGESPDNPDAWDLFVEKGLKGETGQSFASFEIDENGDIYVYTSDSTDPSSFEYNEDTGDLNYIQTAEDGSSVKTLLGNLKNNNSGITTETDPTVPAWAKSENKPFYTKDEIGLGNVDNVQQYSVSNPPPYPVTSINGKTGEVTLDAAAVGARDSTWLPTASEIGAASNSQTITITGIDADGVSHAWTVYGVID